MEETYLKHPEYTKFCVLDEGIEGCKPPSSLLAPGMLFNYTWDGNNPEYLDLTDVTQEQIDARLTEIVNNPMLAYQLGYFFDSTFGKSCSELETPESLGVTARDTAGCEGRMLKSKYVRSAIDPAGMPLDDYLDKQDK